MRLPEYIEKTGDETFAAMISGNPRTVKAWRLGERVPSRRWANKIISTVKGMTYEDIYAPEKGVA